MPRLLIGNDFNEDLRDDRKFAGWWVQRLLWFAEDDDILVLPEEPEQTFVNYVCGLTGVQSSTLRVIVPPPGRAGTGLLSADRIAAPAFVEELAAALRDRSVDEVFPLWPDAAVATLASALGLESAVPGYGFIAESGGRLVNSKPMFRAIAAGIGIPLPAGGVVTNPADAEVIISGIFDLYSPVILKREFLSGGRGNEILSQVAGVRPYGARQVVLVESGEELRSYLHENWDRLTSGGRSPLVLERYHRDSPSIFAEFLLTDDAIELSGVGEMLPSSYAVGEIIPVPWLKPDQAEELIDGGRRLSRAVHGLGYRGYLSADAILTPDGEILFTEFNGRVTGSTHVYGMVGKRVVGEDYADDRVLLERSGWLTSSFQEAERILRAAGLAYDARARRGIVLLSAFDPEYRAVMYCVVAEHLDRALAIERELISLTSGPSKG